MARPLRIEMPDGVDHVTSRGFQRRVIVRDDVDRDRWLACRQHTRASAETIGRRFGDLRGAAVWHIAQGMRERRQRDERLHAKLAQIERHPKVEN